MLSCVLVLMLSQGPAPSPALQSLIDAERAFARMAEKEGVSPAFLQYLADDGLLFRPRPTPGKQVHREKPVAKEAKLKWEPRFVTVAADGTLGLSTGPYTYQAKPDAPAGRGHFVTVWRKEAAGWRALLDLGAPHPVPGPLPPLTWIEPGRSAVIPPERRAALVKELHVLEEGFVSSAASEAAAYGRIAHPQVRWMRMGQLPRVGLDSARAAWLKEKPAAWRPAEVVLAGSGDFAFSHGNYTLSRPGGAGVYVHVYVRDGIWKLLLDIALPLPGE